MKKEDIDKAQNVLKQLDTHISDFLSKLIHEEFNLVDTPRVKKIVLREWSACGIKYNAYETTAVGHYKRNEGNTCLKKVSVPTEFQRIQVNDDSVDVLFEEEAINIPLEYTEEQFHAYCREFFKPLLRKLEEVEKKHKREDEEAVENKKAEEKLMGIHVDGKYTYQWKQCEHCKGDGYIYRGTGKYAHQGAYDREGDYYETEVKEKINCPQCQGSGGFVEYSIKGKYGSNKKPCSKWRFEQNQDDFLEIVLN